MSTLYDLPLERIEAADIRERVAQAQQYAAEHPDDELAAAMVDNLADTLGHASERLVGDLNNSQLRP